MRGGSNHGQKLGNIREFWVFALCCWDWNKRKHRTLPQRSSLFILLWETPQSCSCSSVWICTFCRFHSRERRSIPIFLSLLPLVFPAQIYQKLRFFSDSRVPFCGFWLFSVEGYLLSRTFAELLGGWRFGSFSIGVAFGFVIAWRGFVSLLGNSEFSILQVGFLFFTVLLIPVEVDSF